MRPTEGRHLMVRHKTENAAGTVVIDCTSPFHVVSLRAVKLPVACAKVDSLFLSDCSLAEQGGGAYRSTR
jgi:hypothetical protein